MRTNPTLRRARFLGALAAALAALSSLALPPTITQHPGVVSSAAGAAAELSVVASGDAPLTYQWRRLGHPLPDADQPALQLSEVEPADAGFYDVVVTANGESTVSQPGRLVVHPASTADVYRADPGFGFVAEGGGAAVMAACLTVGDAVLVGGTFSTIAGNRRDGLARFTSAFELDLEFAPAVAGSVFAIAVQSDGRIVIGGGFTHVNGVPRSCLARLNSDGSLDHGFFPGAGLNGNVYALLVQPDGRIVAAGTFTTADGVARGRIARFEANGALDPTFATGAGFDDLVKTLGRQQDGHIVAGGRFGQVHGTAVGRIARLDGNGGVDVSFGGGSGANADVESLAVLANDSILVAGAFSAFNGVPANRAVRLTAAGARDAGFAAPALINGALRAIVPAPGGRIWIAGDYSSTAQRFLNRLLPDGTLDGTWNPAGTVRVNTSVYAVAAYGDGRVVAGGAFTQLGGTANSAGGVVRYNNNATLSEAAPDGGFRQPAGVAVAVPAPGGRWLVGGTFTHINGVARNRIARIQGDGTLDATFDPGSGFNAPVTALTRQGDGRILVAGQFSVFAGEPVYGTARLEESGAFDESFVLDSRIQGDIATFVVQPDGRILVAGGFSTAFDGTRSSVARLFGDGALDESFDLGPGASGAVDALGLRRDGSMVVGGRFTELGGVARGRLALLGPTGALDAAFNSGAGFDAAVAAVQLRADESVLAGGAFTTQDGALRRGAAAFGADGAPVAGFNSGPGFAGGVVSGLAPLPDGRVVVSGTFSALDSLAMRGLARLATDGSRDPAFAAFDLSVGEQRNVLFTGDGRLLLVNANAAFVGGRHLGLAMLTAGASPLPIVTAAPGSRTVVAGTPVVFAVAASGAPTLRYQWRKDGVDLSGQAAATLDLGAVGPASSGTYTVVVANDHGRTEVAAVLTVVAATSYSEWALTAFGPEDFANPAVAGALADPDGVGLVNLQRYAFGLAARGPVAPPVELLTVEEAGRRYVAVRFDRSATAEDLLYTVEASADLSTWTTVETLGPGLPQERTIRDLVALDAAPRRFLRVRVELVD